MPGPKKVVVDIVGSAKGYTDATEQAVSATGRMNSALETIDKKLAPLNQKGGIAGAILGGVGLGAGMGLFNTVKDLVGGTLDNIGHGIGLASDKAESASKANVLFGDSYGIVEEASKSAAQTVAMSSGAYLTAAGDVGNLLKNMGIAGDEAAHMSTNMIQLAADMGSFNNADPSDVIEAMGSAFRGEMDPIEQFGVFLNADKIKAEALAEGLIKAKQPLNDNAKALATYHLILKQTGAAQGDLARTSDGLANKQRLAAARQEEAYTRLGDAILPLANEVLPALTDATTMAVGALTDMVSAAKASADGLIHLWEIWTVRDEEGPRKAAAEVQGFTDALAAMPEATGVARTQLEAIAKGAQAAGTGLAGATAELQDLVRWSDAISKGGSQLVGMTRNFEKWSDWVDQGTISADQFDRKVRSMVQGGLQELEDNIDILPPKLADVVRYFGTGQAAVDDFAKTWVATASDLNSGKIDVTEWSKFLVDNVEFVSDHWKQIPVWMQDAMVAAGVVTKQGVDLVEGHLDDLGRYIGVILPGAWSRMPKAAEKAGSEAADAIDHAVKQMHQTLEDASAPWKAEWAKLAAWAKNPFKPDSFEDWISGRIRAAIKKSNDDSLDEATRRRWAKVAKLMKDPVIQAGLEVGLTVDEALADIALVKEAGKGLRDTIVGSITGIFGNGIVVRGSGTGGAKTPKRKASGGHVNEGDMLVVGELGEEGFVPDTDGTIIPHAALMGGGGGSTVHQTFHVNLHVNAWDDEATIGARLTRAIAAAARRDGGVGLAAAIRATR